MALASLFALHAFGHHILNTLGMDCHRAEFALKTLFLSHAPQELLAHGTIGGLREIVALKLVAHLNVSHILFSLRIPPLQHRIRHFTDTKHKIVVFSSRKLYYGAR